MGLGIERICLLLGRDTLRWWLEEALLMVERDTDATVSLIVRTDTDGAPAEPLTHPFDAEVRYTTPTSAESGPAVRIPQQTVSTIADECDVVVQNGVGILTGEILTEPTYGVLSYHHGDIREYRGVLTHFWNYLNGDEAAGVTLLQVDESLDGGGIAAETTVDLTGCRTWSEIESRKHIGGIPLIAQAVEHFADPDFEPERVPEAELGRMYYSSDVTLPVIARYAVVETARTVHDRVTNLGYLLSIYWKN
jgi:folate-dependent phosphoribosylglycinamide formyltransferase PurN